MIDADYLLTFAEIGVAFAGFSSLVALLGSRRTGESPAIDAVRLQVMLEASLFVALMSVVPLVPGEFGASSDSTWRLSALIYLALDGFASYVSSRRWLSVIDQYSPQDRLVSFVVIVLSLGADLLLLPVLFGLLLAHAQALYLAALIANLALAGALFIRFTSSTFLRSGE